MALLVLVGPDLNLVRTQLRSAAIGNIVRSAVFLGVIGGTIVAVSGILWGQKGVLLSFGLGMAVTIGLWCLSGRLVIRATGAEPVATHGASDIQSELRQLSRRAGIATPRLYVVPVPQPNAFAVGRSSRHASIVVTEGLVSLLEPAEVRAVLAHEVAHVCRRDTLGVSIAGSMVSGVYVVAGMRKQPRRTIERRGREDHSGTIVAAILSLTAHLLRFTVSIAREGEADRVGSTLTGDPETLALALKRMDDYAHVVPMDLALAQVSAWTVNPFGDRAPHTWIFSGQAPHAHRIVPLGPPSDERAAT
jgi:heat shock protein HtpX